MIQSTLTSAGEKNFTYGDIWVAPIPEPIHKERKKVNPEDYTTNASFLNFLEEVKYDVYIDYTMHGKVAFTDPKNKTIFVNGNYKKEMIEPFLQHELGHLMLFDVNTFTTIKDNSLRSIIVKIIYTPEKLKKHGIEKLFYVENVVQDVIIETVSGNFCVCSNSLAFYKENMGVKHLENLEDVKTITKEVCNNLLNDENTIFPSGNSELIKDLLESMLNDLQEDTKEIRDSIEEESSTRKYHKKELGKIEKEKDKINSQMGELENKLEKLQNKKSKNTSKIKNILEKLKEKLKEVNSEKTKNEAIEKAEKTKERKVKSLKKKLQHNEKLIESFEEQLQKIQESTQNSNSEENTHGNEIVDNQLHANLIDHLLDDTQENGNARSFDCGLPYPQKISRKDSHRRENNLRIISGSANIRKTIINRESSYNVKGNGQKSPEKELSYFKSNKKEFDETDMLKGKKVVRLSGINVMIGLDVSGSMSEEWTIKFNEISNLIEELKEKIDIEDVVYFTYNTKIVKYSQNIEDLDLVASGGNAFGYVYQEAMKELPIRNRNEFILVTDCGDNLGFRLNNVCETNLDQEEVINHISIIDTESAGFYAKRDFDNKDWSLYASTDRDLHKNIKRNIENLIDK